MAHSFNFAPNGDNGVDFTRAGGKTTVARGGNLRDKKLIQIIEESNEVVKCCEHCRSGQNSLSSSDTTNKSGSPAQQQNSDKKKRPSPGRKDADAEFFHMTLLSQIMTHKKQKQLIEMQSGADQLFVLCKQSKKPFFEWSNWISAYIEKSLADFAEHKKSRLANIYERAKTQLMGRVEEKKVKESILLQSSKDNERKWLLSHLKDKKTYRQTDSWPSDCL